MKCQISILVFQSPSVPLLPLDTQGHEGDVEEYDDTSDLAADDDDDVGKHVPLDGRYTEPADLRTGPDRFLTDWKDTYVNMPKSHICINMT